MFMTKKGSTKVLKTQTSGKVFRKEKYKTFLLRPNPGKHNLAMSVTAGYILRDILHLADNLREATYIVRNRELLVDKKPVSTVNYPVGLYDVIELPKLKKCYRVSYTKNGLIGLIEIPNEESKYKITKLVRKKITKKGQIHLTTNDGRTIITTNNGYKTKASVKLDLEDNTIKEYYPLEKGRKALLIGGKYIGQTGIITDITKGSMIKKELVRLKVDDKEFETTEKNIFVVN